MVKKRKPKKRNHKKEYAARVRKGLLAGKTVQQARGHTGGDRGKVAVKQRGTKVIKAESKRKFTSRSRDKKTVLSEFDGREFSFLGKDESLVFPRVRAYAERQRKKNPDGLLLYRFVYMDEKYSDRSGGAYSTTSYQLYIGDERWDDFMKMYREYKERSVANVIASVLFGYTG